ncbi:macrophage mannose receptor 1b isoform X1 [Nerophis lumbriciformis]|uniref:macrophage mannose receptor 1b isoform X1 n=1 Tax=Nerophis lumbriciformis TaxID=546530 RepID=UPI002ADFCAB1|nr:macrophage mannose receptor 1-like isoform X1 [Nerophis lumbriciformis]
MSSALRLIRRMLTAWITLAALVPTCLCSLSDDSSFSLVNKATGSCLLKKTSRCLDVRWTSGDRMFVTTTKKCLGAQGRSVGSEVNVYDCDDKSDLQKWECRNGTLLALKGQQLYIELFSDSGIRLSKTTGPSNEFTIMGTANGACSRTHRAYYTIDGNGNGRPCMFPFLYKDRWFGDCTPYDSSIKRPWCAIGTKYEHELWGYCPTTSTEHWNKNHITGAYYQLNTQSVLSWAQADVSCKQQGANLVSITDTNEQAFISALLGNKKNRLWIGLVLNPEHGWLWSDGRPMRYLRWSSGYPLPNPGHNCALLDSDGLHRWQTLSCAKKIGYICFKAGAPPVPPQVEQGFCTSPWIPYNGHCFHLVRTPKTWTDAQKDCRKEEGALVSMRNVEDFGFVVSQLGYGSTDELWIGFNDRRTEGLFEWSDAADVTFTVWQYGEPTTSADDEDCVLMGGENGNWADRSCDEKHGFVCMKQSSTTHTADEIDVDIGCKAGWKRHGSYCYFVGTETRTFDEAKDHCKTSDSSLADVFNGVDNAFLVSLVGLRPEKYFWLGLSNQKDYEMFEWTNDQAVRFTHWNNEMPGNRQGCVAMTTGILAGLWDLLPCTNKEKYICKHLAEGAVLTPPPPTVVPPQCAEGWIRSGTRNICSKFFTGPREGEKTWFEARDYCRAIGGDLLSIHNSAELFVGRHGKAWIGLHIADPSTGYVWSDGSPLNYQHWQEGEPNNFQNSESCTEFRIHRSDDSGSWNDVHCESYNDWLCQIRAGVTPKPPPNDTAPVFNETSDGWLQWRGSQYYINRDAKAMEDARHFCQQRHGDLVSISSEAESIFLWKQVSRSYGTYYIGLSVDLDGSFWWMDGTSVGYQRWDEDQPDPNSYDKNCVVMNYFLGLWRGSNCGEEHQFMCKRGSSAPVNTTASPTVPPKGGCPLKWTKFDSRCYSINSNRKTTWEEARKQCITMGGNLVSIATRRVQAFLTTKMAEVSADLWIGLNSLTQDAFFWSDGKARHYTNWVYSVHRRRQGSFYQRWNEESCVLMTNNPTLGIGKWMIKSCNDSNGFICTRSLDSGIPSQPEPAVPNIYMTLGNDSIKAVTQKLSWDQAKKHCEGDKAKLASLRNEWTQAYVELLALNLKAPLWIGLNKKETQGYFRYIDGWHMPFASWDEGEPSQDRPCVYLDLNGKFKTALCNQTMSSVCMQSTDVPPTQSLSYPGICPEEAIVDYQQSYTWLPFKSHCYLFATDEIEWANAASSCVRHGGLLASIEDPEEQAFIQNNIEVFQDSHTSFWVGLYKTHKGTWMWLDKTTVDYTNWSPEANERDFGEIRTADGTWMSGLKWHDRAYICETPKVMPNENDPESQPRGGPDSGSRGHTSLIVVLIITLTSSLIVLAFFLYKKSSRSLPTFDNPLYFGRERTQPDVVDTNKLIEKAEEEIPEPIIAL